MIVTMKNEVQQQQRYSDDVQTQTVEPGLSTGPRTAIVGRVH